MEKNWKLQKKSKLYGLLAELSLPDELNNFYINVVGQSQIDKSLRTFYKNNRLDEKLVFSLCEVSQ